MMPHSLQDRVAAVRSRALWIVRLHGLCMFLCAVLVVVLAISLLDYFLRWRDDGIRWIVSIGAWGIVGWLAFRLIQHSIRYRPTLVQVARRIEEVHPQLKHRLSSAIDFLAQDERDLSSGSPELRRAVVAETESLAAGLDFRQATDSRRAWQAVGVAMIALLVVGGFVAADFRSARIAAERLAIPWSKASWPRRHSLSLVKRVDKLASGDDLEIEVVDRSGRLPESVRLELRHPTTSGGTRTETKEMKLLGDRMIFRLDNVTAPLVYRVVGGDDDTMSWTDLQVIEPPKVLSLAVDVEPPSYTGLAKQTHRGRVVRVLAGSQVRVRVSLDKPIELALLRTDSPNWQLPPIAVAPRGRSFVSPPEGQSWIVENSGSFSLELVDKSGLPTGRDTRVEIQAVEDSPPTISWSMPSDHTFVTARALVNIGGLIKDDLGIRRVELRYLRPGAGETAEQTVELYVHELRAAIAKGANAAGLEGETQEIDVDWDLSDLSGLKAGDVLAVRITAEDHKPQLTTSSVRRLSVISDEELESRISQRQSSILNQMSEALRIQRDCRQQLASVLIRLEERGSLDASDLNHVQSILLNQRQVEKLLSASPEGAQGEIKALLEELAANRIESQLLHERMNELLAALEQVNQRPLPEVGSRLSDAIKAAQEATNCDGPVAAEELKQATERQAEVIATLEELLGTLTQWDSFSRLAREIGQIRVQEESLAAQTEKLRLAAIGSTSAELPAEERVTARQLAQEQLELARRLDKIQVRMEEMLVRMQSSDQLAAATLADALDAARRLAIGGQMRSAASQLTSRQIGDSVETQREVIASLKELEDMLSTRREHELARSIKALRVAAGEAAGLVRGQGQLQGELESAVADPDEGQRRRRVERLSKELQRLAQQSQELGRRLQRLQAPRAAAAASAAAESGAAAGQAAADGDAEAAAEHSRTTGQQLEDLEREIQVAIAQAEAELASQMLARIEQWIKGLLARQRNVIVETTRLEEARAATNGNLPAAKQATLREVAAEQRHLAGETMGLTQETAQAAAFVFALEGAANQMTRAAELLERGETASTTLQAEQAAAARLEQLLAAINPEETTAEESTTGEPQSGGGNSQATNASSLAELKLLHLMQQAIHQRTQALEALRQKQELADDQKQELDRMAEEQGRLAEMAYNLIQEAKRLDDGLDALLDGKEPLEEGSKSGPTKDSKLDQELLKELEDR